MIDNIYPELVKTLKDIKNVSEIKVICGIIMGSNNDVKIDHNYLRKSTGLSYDALTNGINTAKMRGVIIGYVIDEVMHYKLNNN